MIDVADYAPTTAVEAAHYVNCQKLAETLRETAAVIEFCRAVVPTPAEAVVVGLGDDPWDQSSFTIDQLEQIGCRLMLGPAEDEPITTQFSQSSTFNTNETHAYDLQLRRQVLAAEFETVGAAGLFAWFWSHVAALPQQTRLAADGCLIIKEFNCTSSPAFNGDEEANLGLLLHANFRVTVGDVEGG